MELFSHDYLDKSLIIVAVNYRILILFAQIFTSRDQIKYMSVFEGKVENKINLIDTIK